MTWKTILLLPFLLQPCLAAQAALKTDEDKILYSLGMILGRNFKRNLTPFNLKPAELKPVAEGLKDSITGASPRADLNVYGPKLQEWAEARQKTWSSKIEAEKKKGLEFQAKMAKEKGAFLSPTGLVYIEERAGAGPNPAPTDTVKVNYEGTFIDGKVFDSSYQRNEPAEFALNQVVRCWTEGVARMKAGGKAKLVCPSDLAYGDGGTGSIPPGATLVFTVELLDILKK